MAFFGFGNLTGLLGLISLVPLIIIYLIKPKAKEIEVPSLMFFIKSQQTDKQRSFLRRFIFDMLFFLQILILVLLSFHLAEPYLNISKTSLLDNVIIVLDNSASMQAFDGKYFKTAVKEAKDHIGGINSIILVSNSPIAAVKDKSKEESEIFLDSLQPSEVRSDIGDSILLAGELAKGQNPAAVIISDFLSTEGTDIENAINALKTKGISIATIDVRKNKKPGNVGIINVNVGDEDSQVVIKNFNDEDKEITLKTKDLEKSIRIQKNSVEVFSFKTQPGITKIEISPEDDLAADNYAYISKPGLDKIKVLLITDEESIFLKSALEASSLVQLETAHLPVIPKDNYDIYIIHNIDKSRLITGVFENIREKVSEGAGLIIHGQEDSKDIDYGDLLPLKIAGSGGFTNLIKNQVGRLTKDVEFGVSRSYLKTSDDKSTKIVSADDNSTIISMAKYKKGMVAYYSILEDYSDFKINPSYPVFIINLIEELAGVGDVSELNKHTGEIISFDEKTSFVTPSGEKVSDVLFMNKAGVYQVNKRVYAANIMSEKESSLKHDEKSEENVKKIIDESAESRAKYPVSDAMIIISIILIFAELVMTKLRGDV